MRTLGLSLLNKSKQAQSSWVIWGGFELEGTGSGCGLSLAPLTLAGPSCGGKMDLPLGQMSTILAL